MKSIIVFVSDQSGDDERQDPWRSGDLGKKYVRILALALPIGRLCEVTQSGAIKLWKYFKYAKISVVVDQSPGWDPSRRRFIKERCKNFIFFNLYLQTKFYKVCPTILNDPGAL